MKIEEIRGLDDKTLHQEIENMEKELLHLRLGNAIGTVENPVQIRGKRKDVARMKTVLTERKLQTVSKA